MGTLNLKSTAWTKGSPNSTGWTKGSVSSTAWTKGSVSSTNYEPAGLFSESALLLQDGVSFLLLQDSTNNLGLQV